MAGWIVAGTGTEIGKTHVACALIRGWRAAGQTVRVLKPVLSGVDLDDPSAWADSDPGRLLAAAEQPLTQDNLRAACPYSFRAPLSPDQAAAREGRSLRLEEVLGAIHRFEAEASEAELLVEGAGGVMSPLGVDATQLELWRALGWPVLLVGGTYLGSISHTLTALAAIGAQARAVVLSESEHAPVSIEETAQSLARFTDRPIVLCRRGQERLDPRVLPRPAP